MPNNHEAAVEEAKAILNDWEKEASRISKECGRYEIRYKKLNYSIAIPTIIFSSISGCTALIALINGDPAQPFDWYQLPYNRRFIVATLSLSVAILAGLQNLFRFGELAEKYRAIGIGYEKIAIDIMGIHSNYEKELVKIKSRMQGLTDMMPDVVDFGMIHRHRNRRNTSSLNNSQSAQ